MLVDEKLIRVLFVLIGLLIVVLLRMFRIETMVCRRPDIKTVDTMISTHSTQLKSELVEVVNSLGPDIEDSIMAVGGVCAYESYRNKQIITNSLITLINAYNHLDLLDYAIEAVDELVELLNSFEEDMKGSRKLTSSIEDLPSLNEIQEEREYYVKKLEVLSQLKEKVDNIGR